MKKIILSIISFLLFPLLALAAPSISSVSGELTQNGTITITGLEFGTKSQAAPIKWDNFDSGTVGQDLQGYSFIIAGGSAPVRPKYTTDRFYGLEGKASAGNCVGQQYDCGYLLTGINRSKVYLSYHVYVDNTAGATSRNVKFARFTSADLDTVHGDLSLGYTAYYANTLGAPSNGGIFYTYNGRGSEDSSGNFYTSMPTGQWVRVEMYGDLSDPDVANGSRGFWINKGTKTYSENVVNLSSESASTFYRNLIMPFYVAHDINDGTNHYIYRLSDYRLFTDNLYFDDTLARVELCDSATWPTGATTANCQIQIPSSWSDDSVSASVSQGSLSAGQTAYIYVIDPNGNANTNGYPVTIGGTSTPPTSKVGDLNSDNAVDILDYNLLVSHFNQTGSGVTGDINSSGRVEIFDYNLLVGNFGL